MKPVHWFVSAFALGMFFYVFTGVGFGEIQRHDARVITAASEFTQHGELTGLSTGSAEVGR